MTGAFTHAIDQIASPELCKHLCVILVNVASQDSLQFMQDQYKKCNDEIVKSILEKYIQGYRLA